MKWWNYLLIIFFAVLIFAAVLHSNGYALSVTGAINKMNVEVDEIYYDTQYKDSTVLIYRTDNLLCDGVVDEISFLYHWNFSTCSAEFIQTFNEEASTSISNHQPHFWEGDADYITIASGVIYNDAITAIDVVFKNEQVPAEIIDTTYGRIWFAFSSEPVNYTPELVFSY